MLLPAGVAGLLIAVVAITLATGDGVLLRILFPSSAAVGALALVRSRPTAYLGLVWWLWILTPEVRRLSDYQAGYDPTSAVVLAPLVASAACLVSLLPDIRALVKPRLRGFLMVGCGIAVGLAVGLVRGSHLGAIYGAADWFAPPLVSVHVVWQWRLYPAYRQKVERLALASLTVISAYALVQYFVLPGWDAYWALHSGLAEYPTITPEHFRPFSTLNSAAPFAFVLAVLILVVSQIRSALGTLALALGATALAVSGIRAGWVVLVVGLAYLVVAELVAHRAQVGQLARVGLVVALPFVVVGLLPGQVATGPGGTRAAGLQASTRVRSVTVGLGAVSHDTSFSARVGFYKAEAPVLLHNPEGRGTGSTGTATKLSSTTHDLSGTGNFDSGLLAIPYELGWLGTALYALGVALVVRHTWRGGSGDLLAVSARAVAVSGLVYLVFANDLTGASGFFIWVLLGLAVASRGSVNAAGERVRSGGGALATP